MTLQKLGYMFNFQIRHDTTTLETTNLSWQKLEYLNPAYQIPYIKKLAKLVYNYNYHSVWY